MLFCCLSEHYRQLVLLLQQSNHLAKKKHTVLDGGRIRLLGEHKFIKQIHTDMRHIKNTWHLSITGQATSWKFNFKLCRLTKLSWLLTLTDPII